MKTKVNGRERDTKKLNLRKKTIQRNIKNKKFTKPPIKFQRETPKSEHGFIYIGHIPHGFYEEEMRSYFSQFGTVINVRLCRSHRTGQSKGYGFIEFENPEVAKIAAETMDNYLMFKKRLEAKFVPANKMMKMRIHSTKPWSVNECPLKEKRRQLNQQKNANPDHNTYIKQCRNWMRSIRKTLSKLKDLGIEYSFQPVDVPSELCDVTLNE